jgi:hypothetical protein
VHGAFADASSWNGVIERLQHQGYIIEAPANPLRGVGGDSAYLASVVNQIDGPVLLVVSQPQAVVDLIVKAAQLSVPRSR